MPLLPLEALEGALGKGDDADGPGFTTVRRDALTGTADGPRTSATLGVSTDGWRWSAPADALMTGFMDGDITE